MAAAEAAMIRDRVMAASVRTLGTSGSRPDGSSRLPDMRKSQTAAAGNYLRNGYYREARNTLDGMGEHEKTARWYYYSAMAHMGLGNNVAALEHAGKAASLEPQNMEYQMLLQRLQSGGQWYESRQAAYGYPNMSGNDLCLKICLANLFCNLCCGGGGLCFGGYGGRGMF